MNKAIIGRKVGMTQIFAEDGKVIPVTVVEAGPCPVVQVKTVETDGYCALKLGFDKVEDEKKSQHVFNKPELKEVRLASVEGFKVGDELKADVFAAGDKVDAHGTSKGHGYTGVIKRWNQHRLKETHGVGPVHREPGSMGSISDPSRVFKHKNLAGQWGVETVTIQNLEVVRVDAARNAILIKGAIPGPKGSIVTLADSVKVK